MGKVVSDRTDRRTADGQMDTKECTQPCALPGSGTAPSEPRLQNHALRNTATIHNLKRRRLPDTYLNLNRLVDGDLGASPSGASESNLYMCLYPFW